MKLGLHQTPRMDQRLLQSPQMIQSMQILQLSAQGLDERIEQELEENPLLEMAEPGPDGASADGTELVDGDARAELERDLERLERSEKDMFSSTRAASLARAGRSEEDDAADRALQNAPARLHSLNEALLEEVSQLELGERDRQLAEYLIWSLDERGYLADPVETLAAESPLASTSPDELRSILKRLREVSHPGLGAHDLADCLLIQLEAAGEGEGLAARIVRLHLADLIQNRLPRIAKNTGATLEDVRAAIEQIRSLEPFPGREYGGEPAAAIQPDVIVEEEDGQYRVRLARSSLPRLRLSRAYKELLRQAAGVEGAHQWLKKRLEAARWFLDAIHQRESTLEKIARSIFEHQRDFLDKGVRALKPLRMQTVADAAGVHISTVSRAVSGKHAQTPRGIYPLKFFFTSGTAKQSGELESQVSIKARIQELVALEDAQNPLSDDQIAEKLESLGGVKIARRTVTKYRKALGLPASSQRKKF